MSVLPSWHIFERAAEYWMLGRGARLVYSTIKSFKADLAAHRPHFVIAVPRLYESIFEGVQRKFR